MIDSRFFIFFSSISGAPRCPFRRCIKKMPRFRGTTRERQHARRTRADTTTNTPVGVRALRAVKTSLNKKSRLVPSGSRRVACAKNCMKACGLLSAHGQAIPSNGNGDISWNRGRHEVQAITADFPVRIFTGNRRPLLSDPCPRVCGMSRKHKKVVEGAPAVHHPSCARRRGTKIPSQPQTPQSSPGRSIKVCGVVETFGAPCPSARGPTTRAAKQHG